MADGEPLTETQINKILYNAEDLLMKALGDPILAKAIAPIVAGAESLVLEQNGSDGMIRIMPGLTSLGR